MSDNQYYTRSLDFQKKLKEYVSNIFKTYGRELVLRLEEYNLLQSKHNCIESSTAIGFILEEFIVAKLDMYTHCSEEDYIIDRHIGATTVDSYDCFSKKDGNKFLINVKAERKGSNNNAIAAIKQLYHNYCEDAPEQEKSYVILKIGYSIAESDEDDENRRAKPRHIYIDSIKTYCLEEVDLSKEHRQDNRSWSEKGKNSGKNNGRLMISDKFREEHKMPYKYISYQNTFAQLTNLVETNV